MRAFRFDVLLFLALNVELHLVLSPNQKAKKGGILRYHPFFAPLQGLE